jgi:hypothetical protein
MEDWSSMLHFFKLSVYTCFHHTSQPKSEFTVGLIQVVSATDAPCQNYSVLTHQTRYWFCGTFVIDLIL